MKGIKTPQQSLKFKGLDTTSFISSLNPEV